MKAEDIKEQMAGLWELYFRDRFGLDVEAMQGVPCPFCGGDDRFSWTNYRDAGGYLCRGHAEGRYTDGIAFAQELWQQAGMGAGFRDILGDIAHWLTNAPAVPRATPASPAVSPETVQKLSWALSGDWSAVDLVVHPYVQKKGLGHLVPLANRQTRVKPWGQSGEVIVVPQFDPSEPFGKPIGAEVIAVDGKWSVKGGKRGVHPLPSREAEALVCVEGWASALAAAEMLPEFQVVACGGKKTLQRQAEALRESTGKRVVLCWEDDGDAAEAPAGAVVLPRTDRGNDPADWRTHEEAVAEFQRDVALAAGTVDRRWLELG